MQIQQQVPLAPLTTLRIGGPARYFARIEQEADLPEALAFAAAHGLRLAVLGGGSNLVVPDCGFDGLVLHLALGDRITEHAHPRGRLCRVDAGVEWDALVLHLCTLGLSGMECLAGIPGLTGASPVQNIGAYGQEVASTLCCVRAFDRQAGTLVELSREQCQFGYRTSVFNAAERDRYLITRVDFLLDPAAHPDLRYADLAPLRGTEPSPLEVYHAVRAIRDRKGMVIHPGQNDPDTRSAGSFFKNPAVPRDLLDRLASVTGFLAGQIPNWPTADGKTKLAAAWLIEQAGFPKGFSVGPAAISSRHTLALTNHSGTARAEDLFRLRDTIRVGVQARFGIELDQEPILLA